MQIMWMGHSSFRLEIGNQVFLIDPWMTGNPMFPADQRGAAISGATAILLTHAHDDHAAEAPGLSKELGVPVLGMYDLVNWWEATQGITSIGMNKGGTATLGDVTVTLVNACHSSTLRLPDGTRMAAGSEAGLMISHAGRTIYVSGDTDIMADMEWMGDLHKPEIGILCAGGHFTMDMTRAAYAARRYFNFKTVIPCHYRTFPLLEQSAEKLVAGLPGVRVIEPQVMQPIQL